VPKQETSSCLWLTESAGRISNWLTGLLGNATRAVVGTASSGDFLCALKDRRRRACGDLRTDIPTAVLSVCTALKREHGERVLAYEPRRPAAGSINHRHAIGLTIEGVPS
jgi:hypothetical protein